MLSHEWELRGGRVSVKPCVCPSVFSNCPSAGILLYVEKHGVGVPHGTVTKHKSADQPTEHSVVVVILGFHFCCWSCCCHRYKCCCHIYLSHMSLNSHFSTHPPHHPVHPQNILAKSEMAPQQPAVAARRKNDKLLQILSHLCCTNLFRCFTSFLHIKYAP